MTPFSGPSQRSWVSDDEAPPEAAHVRDDLLERAADDERLERAGRGDAHLGAATARERQAVTLEAVVGVGAQDDVRRRVVGIGVHRVRAVEPARGREADVARLEAYDRIHSPAPPHNTPSFRSIFRPFGIISADSTHKDRIFATMTPMTLASFPRQPLLFGPSPIHRLERLTAHLGGASLWAKRDDCNSGLAFGGNKTRKLEYLVADALAQGCDTLVSIGGVQSNHTRQVAAVAARLGLDCVLVQESWVEWPDVVYDRVGNILLSRLMGADVRLVRAEFGIGFKESWEQALRDVEERGGKPYAIPAGASDHPLGGLGFASWAAEVAAQEVELGVYFDTVIVCSVTGSTQAGMVAGFALEGTRAPRDRHRRLCEARGDARAGAAHRPGHGAKDRSATRADRERRDPRRPLPRGHLWHP